MTPEVSSTGPQAKRESNLIEEVTYGCNWLCFRCCKSTQMVPKTSLKAERYISVSSPTTSNHHRERTWALINGRMSYRAEEPKEETKEDEKKSPEKVIKSIEIGKSPIGSKEIRELTTTINSDGTSSTELRISFEK